MRRRRGTKPRARSWLIVSALVAALGVGCGSGIDEDPILRLSAEEALEKGRELMEAGKYLQASEHLTHAFEVAPNSAAGREALLRAADALYQSGGSANYIKAEAKYRDFQNRFPTSDRAAYVQLQLANSLAKRVLRADRDQTATRQALEAYRELISLYPTSDHLDEARTQLTELRRRLAHHEYLIGHYHLRRGIRAAAVSRFEGLLEEYPEYDRVDLVLFELGMAHHGMGQAEEATGRFDQLREDYPESSLITKIPAKPGNAKSARKARKRAERAARRFQKQHGGKKSGTASAAASSDEADDGADEEEQEDQEDEDDEADGAGEADEPPGRTAGRGEGPR